MQLELGLQTFGEKSGDLLEVKFLCENETFQTPWFRILFEMFAAGEKLIMFDRSPISTTQKPTDLGNVKYVLHMMFLSVLQWYDEVFSILIVAYPSYHIIISSSS